MENPKINPLNTNGTTGRQTSNQANQRQRTAGNRNAATSASMQQPSKSVGRTGDYGVAHRPGRLAEGDVIRGEISDLRNNEITVTLEDNTILKAKIADGSRLSIGQTAAFRLSSVSAGSIMLEALKSSFTQSELTLINKALEEAGLPSTEHNQSTVKALMDNMLPINKESIQHLMQQSYDYRTNDMNTLAVMNRLMMDMNIDTVNQFSSYRNGTHQLLSHIQEFSQNIPELLNALASNGPADTVSLFGEKLLAIALYDNSGSAGSTESPLLISQLSQNQQQELMNLLSNTPLTEDTLLQLENGTLSIHDALTMIRDSIVSGTLNLPEGMTQGDITDKLLLINTALEQSADAQTLMQETQNSFKNIPAIDADAIAGNIADEEVQSPNDESAQTATPENNPENIKNSDSRINFAGKFFQAITETAKNSINSINNTLNLLQQSANNTDLQTPSDTHTIIDVITDLYNKAGRENDYLNTYLTAAQRNELLNKLSSVPISRSLVNKIASGEATTKEVITVIKNIIPLAEPAVIQELFQSPVFENIFGKFLHSSWTVTPDKLSKDGQIDSFYNKMKTQLKQFEGLIQTALSGEDSENMGRSAHDMESNIEFMKTLSETFSYMQMPLKLQNQDAHADLYVYTQKEKLKKNPENIHVLLHLTLENLGDIDIYIDKNKNDVNTKFMLSDDASAELIKVNADMLKDALNHQGYSCQVKVEQADTDTSTVNEFINTKINTSATTDMKRFSFDIRA